MKFQLSIILVLFCNVLFGQSFNLNDYIITLPEFTQRQLCKFDFSHERWNIEREQLMHYLDSKEYKNSLEINKNKIKEYFSK